MCVFHVMKARNNLAMQSVLPDFTFRHPIIPIILYNWRFWSGTSYSAATRWIHAQERFIISEVADDWHELMIPQRRPSIARANEQLHLRCSMQTYHRPNHIGFHTPRTGFIYYFLIFSPHFSSSTSNFRQKQLIKTKFRYIGWSKKAEPRF